MPWVSDIISYISRPARYSLIAAVKELVYDIDELQMLVTNEEPSTIGLENIIFGGLTTMYLDEDPGFDLNEDFDSVHEEAKGIVDAICDFVFDNIHEVVRPVNAIVDPRRDISRAEAWILRCSMHPDVVEGDEQVKAIWSAWLDEYLRSSADYWELEPVEEESGDFFNTSGLRRSTYGRAVPTQPSDEVEFELPSDVELEPYGPRYDVADLTELSSPPPQNERCNICLEEFGGKTDESPCRQLSVCKHLFHEECLDAWMNASHVEVVSCPNCRADVCDARPRRRREEQA